MTPEDLTKLRALIAARDAAEHDFETKGAAAHYVAAVEASKALKDWLGSKAVAIVEHIERVERNRDMWKGQCERQAEALGSAPHRKEHLMSDVLRAVEEIETWGADPREDNAPYLLHKLIDVLPQLRAALAPVTDEEERVKNLPETLRKAALEWSATPAHQRQPYWWHIAEAAITTLRAALAPVTDEEVAVVKAERDRAQRACEQMGERITLLEAELGRLREALKDMLAHSCVADAGADMKDEEDHAAERRARAALEPKP